MPWWNVKDEGSDDQACAMFAPTAEAAACLWAEPHGIEHAPFAVAVTAVRPNAPTERFTVRGHVVWTTQREG